MLTFEQYAPEIVSFAAKLLRSYLECSDSVQAGIREMIDLVNSPDADDDEREMALRTIQEALFPVYHNGVLGVGLDEADALATANQRDGKAALEEVEREERTFADRLRALIDERGLTQEELATRVGVGQTAIAMMLARQCRPQRRTVHKLAEALGIAPNELWTNAT